MKKYLSVNLMLNEMRYANKLFVFIIFCLILIGSINAQTMFRVVDKENNPLSGVLVTNLSRSIYYDSTDSLGWFKYNHPINNDSILLSFFGYVPKSIANDVCGNIVMENYNFTLTEIEVKGYNPKRLIYKVGKKWFQSLYKDPFLGTGRYIHTIFQDNQCIEMQMFDGLLINPGYMKFKKRNHAVTLDLAPVESRFSIAWLDNSFSEILKPKFSNVKNHRYESFNISIFFAIRSFETFGPLNPQFIKNYNFSIDSIFTKDRISYYSISFLPKNNTVPGKMRCYCKGNLIVNIVDFDVLSIKLADINYSYLPFFNINKPFESPYIASVELYYKHVDNGLFIDRAILTRYWKKDSKEKSFSPPPRLNPWKKKIVDREEFYCLKIGWGKSNLLHPRYIDKLRKLSKLLILNPYIEYNKIYWDEVSREGFYLPCCQTSDREFKISADQFDKNNESFYYTNSSNWQFNNISQDSIITVYYPFIKDLFNELSSKNK